jgi:hypothetical protein
VVAVWREFKGELFRRKCGHGVDFLRETRADGEGCGGSLGQAGERGK